MAGGIHRQDDVAVAAAVCWLLPAWPTSCTPTMPSRLPTSVVPTTMEEQPPTGQALLTEMLLSVMPAAPGSGRYFRLLQVKPTVAMYCTPLMFTDPTSSVLT